VSELAELAAALVAIDSVNPALVPGGAGEAEIAAFVAGWLREAGLEVEVVGSDARPSVLGTARGSGGGRTLMLNAHLDTVGVETMADPFEPRREGERLYGRGSYDMKAALAAAMLAAREAASLALRGDVVLAAVADEELGSVGTETAIAHLAGLVDGAVVCEPTELQTAVAHRGFVGFEIETTGVAAHGSMPQLGVDAIVKMGHVLVELAELDRRLQALRTHPLLPPPSVHASVIEGGQELSSYPERCRVTGERRTLPRETAADVERELAEAIAAARRRDPALDARARALFWRGAFQADPSQPLVQTVLAAAGEQKTVGLPFWTDAGLLGEAGIPTALFGPAGKGAHAAVEWVDLTSVERCREVYAATAAAFCG